MCSIPWTYHQQQLQAVGIILYYGTLVPENISKAVPSLLPCLLSLSLLSYSEGGISKAAHHMAGSCALRYCILANELAFLLLEALEIPTCMGKIWL